MLRSVAGVMLIALLGIDSRCAKAQARFEDRGPRCDARNVAHPGKPQFFPQRNGVAYGVSLPKRSFLVSEPIPAYIWINNTSDKDYASSTCGMWLEWNVAVWNESGERLPSYAERHNITPGSCSANGLIKVKAHSCQLVNELALQLNYELLQGEYRLGQLPWPPFEGGAKHALVPMPTNEESLLFTVGNVGESDRTVDYAAVDVLSCASSAMGIRDTLRMGARSAATSHRHIELWR